MSFIARTTLNEHYEMHDVQTDYKCKECSVHFSHPAVYNTHMMKHLSKYNNLVFVNFEEEKWFCCFIASSFSIL